MEAFLYTMGVVSMEGNCLCMCSNWCIIYAKNNKMVKEKYILNKEE